MDVEAALAYAGDSEAGPGVIVPAKLESFVLKVTITDVPRSSLQTDAGQAKRLWVMELGFSAV